MNIFQFEDFPFSNTYQVHLDIKTVQEDSLFGGIASDISALINENCFEFLDAPVKRVGSLETPIPFQANLEKQYLANARLNKEIDNLLEY